MAAGNDSRRTHRRGRTGGNRLPDRPARRSTKARSLTLEREISEICLRIGVAEAVAAVVSAALKYQLADSDAEAALALQRCVCDVLSAQVDRLQVLAGTTGGLPGEIVT